MSLHTQKYISIAGTRVCGHGYNTFTLMRKKIVGLRIKPTYVPACINSHSKSQPIEFSRVKYTHCQHYVQVANLVFNIFLIF
jgi:hypothetical protein